ncbi:hypothetical protein BC938DRAFT_478148 [Jimgerdemannia flammicorona]|uniref:Phosphoribosyltransferase-like protein n=1 Tax=Jimgerdemannia flammicorona TaxID=994334 RepID=A0A433QND2_9FUNG|nr:hypothetical protein BC938DRAFT_478148 [Jimgerdemannia flammicorona]
MRSQITQITTSPFTTSDEAGEKLGKLLGYYSERNDTVILSVSPAAANISTVLANTLRLPSSSFIIRQVMSPLVPGLSLGSVGATGGQWWNGEYGIGIVKNEEIIRSAKISQADLDDLIKKQVDEVRSTLPSLADTPQLATLPATILLVDTGVNSTTTIRSAVKLLRHFGYHGRVVLACAVIGADAKVGLSTHLKPSGDVQMLYREVSEVVALASPKDIGSPDMWLEFLLPSPTSSTNANTNTNTNTNAVHSSSSNTIQV